MEISYDENNEIKEIKLNDKDIKEKTFLDSRIRKFKSDMNKAKKMSEKAGEDFKKNPVYKINKDGLYNFLLLKDIWIRKLMHKHKLYIKEIKSNPAGAMWGK
jgi:hypothetical protein